MKNAKKLALLTTAIASTTALAATSCGFKKYPGNFKLFGDIQVITDHGSVADKSFNESAFNAAIDASTKDLYSNSKGASYGFTQPNKISALTFKKAYDTAIKAGAKTLVLPGFNHAVTGGINAYSRNHPDINFIGVDVGHAKEDGENFIGLTFQTKISGFMSAIETGLFFNNKFKDSGYTYFNIGTFGGIRIPSVTEYMDGLLQGINYFNSNLPTGLKPLKFMKIDNETNFQSEKYFSGGFAPGQATSLIENMTKSVENNTPSAILGVAGPQTGDILTIIKKNKLENMFAIGVDVDQSYVYESKYMIGSAIKDLRKATADAINHVYGKTNNGWTQWVSDHNGNPNLGGAYTGFTAGRDYLEEYKKIDSTYTTFKSGAVTASASLEATCKGGFASAPKSGTDSRGTCDLTQIYGGTN